VELAHLVPAVSVFARRHPLVVFALLGTALFAGRSVLEHVTPPEPPAAETLTVRVPESADGDEVERATDEAVLLSFATRAGFVQRDPAIRDRLARNVQFVDATLSRSEALEEGLRLQMERSDPVVRARLIWLATETLTSADRFTPTDEQLQAYLERNEARYRRPPTVTFEQIFVSRERHGEALDARVEWVGERLAAGPSDPGLLPASMTRARPSRIDAHFGGGFAERVLALEVDHWSAPLPSTYGVHFVRVRERLPGQVPTLESIRERLLDDYRHDARPERLRSALRRMRSAVRIRVVRSS